MGERERSEEGKRLRELLHLPAARRRMHLALPAVRDDKLATAARGRADDEATRGQLLPAREGAWALGEALDRRHLEPCDACSLAKHLKAVQVARERGHGAERRGHDLSHERIIFDPESRLLQRQLGLHEVFRLDDLRHHLLHVLVAIAA